MKEWSKPLNFQVKILDCIYKEYWVKFDQFNNGVKSTLKDENNQVNPSLSQATEHKASDMVKIYWL